MIHINRNRENIGQFSAQEVADGLKNGRFLPGDLAWRDPMPAWEPLSTFTDLPPPEDVAETNPASTEITAGAKISLGECFSKGWESFRKNLGVLVLGTFVFLIVNISLWFLSELAQKVVQIFVKSGGEEPLLQITAFAVGVFASILTSTITTILSAGFLWMFIKNSRGQAVFADIFQGFSSSRWLQILMAALAWGAILMMIAFFTLVPGIFLMVENKLPYAGVVGAVLFLIPTAYLSVGFGFIFPLILDRGIGWRDAIRTAISTVHRQWFATAGLVLIYTLVAVSGVFVCCVGVLFTMPFGYAVWAEGYRRLFGDSDGSSQG